MKIAHLTTVDLSLRYLILPQLEAALEHGESLGISAPGPDVEFVELRGIRHVPLHSSTRGADFFADLKTMWELWKILRHERPDILHTHNPKPGIYGRILGRLARVPIVVNTVHGLYASPESPLAKRAVVYTLEAIASRFSDAELVQSPEDMELLERLRITPPRKLRLLGNGVDLERFGPAKASQHRDRLRRELGIGPDEVVVGMVGRLVAEKGIPELIDAACQLKGQARFVVVGPDDPDKSDALPRETLQKGADCGVLFLGMREDVADLYGAFDIFVLPSHREGFPRAAMEAAASGLPLIVTDIRGCRQVVDQGENGILFPVGDAGSLARAIASLVEDPDLRRTMGDASVVKAKADFDEKRVVDIVMETYEELAKSRGLAWAMSDPGSPVSVRPARRGDEASIAGLHVNGIETGFLSSLGNRFLRLLYSRLLTSPGGNTFVAVQDDNVVGFVAGSESTGDFYREFLRSSFLQAMWALLPALIRPQVWKKVFETLRYGGSDDAASAELLSMAVAPSVRGRGVGRALVDALLGEFEGRSVQGVRVVVGAENEAAIGLYRRAGFEEPVELEMHSGSVSYEMTWSS